MSTSPSENQPADGRVQAAAGLRSVAETLDVITAPLGEAKVPRRGPRSRLLPLPQDLGPQPRRAGSISARIGLALVSAAVGLAVGAFLLQQPQVTWRGPASAPQAATLVIPAAPPPMPDLRTASLSPDPPLVMEGLEPRKTSASPSAGRSVKPPARKPSKAPRPQAAIVPPSPKPALDACADLGRCDYQDVLAADARVRRAYAAAADSGAPRSVLGKYRKRWSKLRPNASSEPAQAVASYRQLAAELEDMTFGTPRLASRTPRAGPGAEIEPPY